MHQFRFDDMGDPTEWKKFVVELLVLIFVQAWTSAVYFCMCFGASNELLKCQSDKATELISKGRPSAEIQDRQDVQPDKGYLDAGKWCISEDIKAYFAGRKHVDLQNQFNRGSTFLREYEKILGTLYPKMQLS